MSIGNRYKWKGGPREVTWWRQKWRPEVSINLLRNYFLSVMFFFHNYVSGEVRWIQVVPSIVHKLSCTWVIEAVWKPISETHFRFSKRKKRFGVHLVFQKQLQVVHAFTLCHKNGGSLRPTSSPFLLRPPTSSSLLQIAPCYNTLNSRVPAKSSDELALCLSSSVNCSC